MGGLAQESSSEVHTPATIEVVIGGRNKATADQLAVVVDDQEGCQVMATIYTGSDVLTAVSDQRRDRAVDHGPGSIAPHYITKLLLQLGVPSHLNGYHYLRGSIEWLLSQDTGTRTPVTKQLYPILADRFQTRPTRVERGVRHAS